MAFVLLQQFVPVFPELSGHCLVALVCSAVRDVLRSLLLVDEKRVFE